MSTTLGRGLTNDQLRESPVLVKESISPTEWNAGQVTVASISTPVNVIPTPLTGRKTVTIKSLAANTNTVFLGPTSAVTALTGYELSPGRGIVSGNRPEQHCVCYWISSNSTYTLLCRSSLTLTYVVP